MSGLKVSPRPDGLIPRKATHDRFCRSCGKKVSRYKNPRAASTLCYCCEDAEPWSYANIVGGGTHGENPTGR